MAHSRRSAVLRYAMAIGIVAGFLLIRRLLTPVVGDQSPYVILLGATMMSAWFGGFGPGIFAVLLSAVGADYFFVHPLHAFFGNGFIHDSRLVIFILEGIFVSWLTENLHDARRKHEAIERNLANADIRKDEFLAILGHEMRNPLATIRHAIAILRDPRASQTQGARARDTLDRQADYLTRLIDDILDVSRITRGKLVLKQERIDLREAVARAVEQTRAVMEQRRHELLVSVPSGPVMVDGDLMRLMQVVSNLLTNASKYTDEGGRVTLQLTVEEREASISVRDNGIGISPDMLSRVFAPFAQSDRALSRSQGGLGLGLTVVRSIVERHGGSVMAFSAGSGLGSEFVVRLPVSDIHATGESGSESRAKPRLFRRTPGGSAPSINTLIPRNERPKISAAPSRSLRVLVVDDNEDIAHSLSELLKLDGHDTRSAVNARMALDMVKAYKPHAVLLDLHLPDADGCDVARQIRRDVKDRPMLLLALTGHSGNEVRRQCKEAGFDEYLLKPIKHTELVERLNQFAHDEVIGKTTSSPSIPIVTVNS